MKHADLAIAFQDGVRLGRNGADPHAHADFHGDRPRSSWLSNISGIVRHWLGRHQQRHALGMLDDRLLKDIGLGRSDAAEEMRKPFWQP